MSRAGALPHDAHDQKFLADYLAFSGDLGGPCRDPVDNDCHDQIIVLPPASGAPPLDADLDGMPDDWENRFSYLDPADPSDQGMDFDGDGYTEIEEYLNNLAAAGGP